MLHQAEVDPANLCKTANMHIAKKEDAKAIPLLQLAKQLDPVNPEPCSSLARAFENTKQYKLAEEEFNEACIRQPSALTYTNAACFYKRSANVSVKAEDQERNLKLHQDLLTLAQKLKTETLKEVDSLKKLTAFNTHYAKSDFHAVTDADLKKSAEWFAARPEPCPQTNDLAIEHFSKSLSFCPYNLFALEKRGLTFLSKKDFHKALEDFNQILKWNVTECTAVCYLNIGRTYVDLALETRNPETMLQYIKNARSSFISYMLHGVRIEWLEEQHKLFSRLSIIENSFRVLTKNVPEKNCQKESQAICGQIKNAALYRQRGLAHAALGEDQEAMQDFITGSWLYTEGISTDPEKKVHEYVALIRDMYLKTDCFEEAKLCHLSVSLFFLKDFINRLLSGLNREKSKAEEDQLEQLDKIIRAIDNEIQPLLVGEIRNEKSDALPFAARKAGLNDIFNSLPTQIPRRLKRQVADECIKEAKATLQKIDEDFSRELVNKATKKRDEHDYETAIMCYTLAIELLDTDAEIYVGRGHTYWLVGKQREALADFSRASLLEPTNRELEALYKKCYAKVHGVQPNIKKEEQPKSNPAHRAPEKKHIQAKKSETEEERKSRLEKRKANETSQQEIRKELRRKEQEEEERVKKFQQSQEKEKIQKTLEKDAARAEKNKTRKEKRREKKLEAESASRATPPSATPVPLVAIPHETQSKKNIPLNPICKVAASSLEKKLIELLKTKGDEAYIVGGSVLSRLDLKQVSNAKPDMDIVTSASLETIEAQFKDYYVKRDRNNPNRLSFMWSDPETDQAIKVEIWHNPTLKTSIAEEAKGRDFTLNAFYMDENGNVFAGTQNANDHLNDPCIHSINDANESLAKDPIQILRALDLSAKTKKRLSKELEAAVKTHCPGLKKIKTGHLNSQILKFLSNSRADFNFEKWLDHSVIQILFSEIANELRQDKEWIISQLRAIKSRDRGISLNEIFQLFLTSFLKQKDPAFFRKTTKQLIEDNVTALTEIMERNFLFAKQHSFIPDLGHFLSGMIEKRKQETQNAIEAIEKQAARPKAFWASFTSRHSLRYNNDRVSLNSFDRHRQPISTPSTANFPGHFFAGNTNAQMLSVLSRTVSRRNSYKG